jgi:Tfp pilus assembly protein PilP
MHELVCKFVVRKGEDFGESIDVYKNNLIVKVGSEFIGISLGKIEKVEDEKIYISDFDEKEAEALGRKWMVEKSKPVSFEELKIFKFGDEKEKETIKVEQESKNKDKDIDRI